MSAGNAPVLSILRRVGGERDPAGLCRGLRQEDPTTFHVQDDPTTDRVRPTAIKGDVCTLIREVLLMYTGSRTC